MATKSFHLLGKVIKSIKFRILDWYSGIRLISLLTFIKNHNSVVSSLKHRVHSGQDSYIYYDIKYRWLSPRWLRAHKKFFSREERGFGEKSFHAAWNDIITEFRPQYVLEIGVYRGQILSLWKLIAQKNFLPIDVYGITPLENVNDSVSTYMDIDYEADIKKNFTKFNLEYPRILKALSTDNRARELITSRKWDLIYLDGNHDFEIILKDYILAHANLKKQGILCFDDSSLFMNFKIDGVFKGHDGPSRVVKEYASKEMIHLMTVGHNNFFMKI